jgi:alkylation response protein AidB-like acyl-CoA dehydrogenase
VAEEVLRPAAGALDATSPPQRVAPGSPFFTAMATLTSLGYHRLFVPGDGVDKEDHAAWRVRALVVEELGWGSLGLATAFLVDMLPFVSVARFGTDELRAELLRPWLEDEVASWHGCWAITEPDHGSDYLGLRDDDPGIRHGPPVAMLGVRDDPQGELFFDEVFVPDHRVLVPPGPLYPVFGDQLLCMTSSIIALAAVGVARAAFEEALAYARRRVQGGHVIASHKNIQFTLYGMFERVETARAYARAVLAHTFRTVLGAGSWGTGASPRHTRTSQASCKRIAFEVAHDAVQVCGASGLVQGALVDRRFRDARSLLIEDGTVEVLGLDAARDLVGNYEHDHDDLEEMMQRW